MPKCQCNPLIDIIQYQVLHSPFIRGYHDMSLLSMLLSLFVLQSKVSCISPSYGRRVALFHVEAGLLATGSPDKTVEVITITGLGGDGCDAGADDHSRAIS